MLVVVGLKKVSGRHPAPHSKLAETAVGCESQKRRGVVSERESREWYVCGSALTPHNIIFPSHLSLLHNQEFSGLGVPGVGRENFEGCFLFPPKEGTVPFQRTLSVSCLKLPFFNQ